MSPDHVTEPRRRTLAHRWAAATRAAGARWRLAQARRRAARALTRLGAALASSDGAELGPAPQLARAEVARLDARLDDLGAALARSLEEDRQDYAAASSWLRPLAIVRGLATRSLVRDRLWRCRRERAAAWRRLGAAVAASDLTPAAPVAPLHRAAQEAVAREALHAARVERLLHVAGAHAAPALARHAGREAVALGKPLLQEVRARMLPRLPAVAGMAVGWWVASTFTDSRFRATLHALGLGNGPRHAVSSSTLHAMEFWLPLLAAALCSYASHRVGALVRSRYAPERQRTPAGDVPERDASR